MKNKRIALFCSNDRIIRFKKFLLEYPNTKIITSFDDFNNIRTSKKIDIAFIDIDCIERLCMACFLKTNYLKTYVVALSNNNDSYNGLQSINVRFDNYIIFESVNPSYINSFLTKIIDEYKNNKLTIDNESENESNRYIVNIGKEIVRFTKSEFNIFICLLSNKNKTISKVQLYNSLNDENESNIPNHRLRSVDNHIKNIRKKVFNKCIMTVHGIGYCFVSD